MNFLNFKAITQTGNFKTPSENENIEYKEASWKLPKSFWETVSSFANTLGGIIVLGIAEDKSKHEFSITGVDNVDDIETQIFNDNNKVFFCEFYFANNINVFVFTSYSYFFKDSKK